MRTESESPEPMSGKEGLECFPVLAPEREKPTVQYIHTPSLGVKMSEVNYGDLSLICKAPTEDGVKCLPELASGLCVPHPRDH